MKVWICSTLIIHLLFTSQFCLGQAAIQKVDDPVSYRSQDFAECTLHYQIDLHKLKEKSRDTSDQLILEIPMFKGNKIVRLDRFQLIAGNYQLLSQNGEETSSAKLHRFYRGKVEGDPNSKVGLSFSENHVHIIIHDEEGTFEIQKIKESKNLYSGTFHHDLTEKLPFICNTDTQNARISSYVESESIHRSTGLECVEIYLEVDYKAFTENGSTLASVESWVLALMAQVAIFFDDSGIPITVSGIKVYTEQADDPYRVHTKTGQALSAFRDSMQNQGFNGRLAHLLSGRNLGGGIAYLNVLCSNSFNVAVSANLTTGNTTYSTYTWNINVIAHELGHNFGSQHTHDCVWNGNGTQIDDCGNVWLENNNETPGSCYDSENKLLPGAGNATIMSYCHVVGGASINLNLGFHPQVRARIYDRYTSTNCGGQEACVGVPPANDLCEDAIRLTPTIACVTNSFDNLYATDSGISGGFSCASNFGVKDTWFIVKIPEDGKLMLETRDVAQGLTDLVMQVYSGDCSSLSEVYCDDNSGEMSHAKVTVDNLDLANQDVFIRIVSNDDSEGAFGICTYSPDLPCNETALALIDFYNQMNGDQWTIRSGWENGANGSDCNYCQWYGVECNIQEQVVSISLPGNNLSGSLDQSLSSLHNLEILNLANNQIGGNIPTNFISTLYLKSVQLGSNALVGTVPIDLIKASELETLSLPSNGLSGSLPLFEGSTKLTFLDLSNNGFDGCFPSVYTRFLYQGEVALYGNSQLAYGGNFYERPSTYAGFDFDLDGHCAEITDCVDFNEDIYDGAPEICDGEDNDCDGEADEGLDHGPNEWIGASTGAGWAMDSNWSLGHIPKACEDVEIGMLGEDVTISDMGPVQSFSQNLRSLKVGANTTIDLGSRFYFYLKNGSIMNHGELNFNAYTSLSNLAVDKSAIQNFGILNINTNTYLSIYQSGVYGIENMIGGTINNYGTISLDSIDLNVGVSAIRNQSIINNFGRIEVRGVYPGPELLLENGSLLHSPGILDVGGESQSEGGN